MEVLLWIIAVCMVVAGLIGIVVPGLPGTLLVFIGLVAGAWAGHFEKVGWITLGVIAVMGLLSAGVDLLATAFGVKKLGATRWALAGAAAGAIVGFFFGVPGILLGPFIGAFAVELIVGRDPARAGKAGLGAWLGFIVGTAVRLSFAFAMIGLFVLVSLW
jgi:hypothetical protein